MPLVTTRGYLSGFVLAGVMCALFAGSHFAVAAPPMQSPAQALSKSTPDANPETPFLTENETAMSQMMDKMDIKPSGNVDRDFVGMMEPHHQGAIDMAQAELRYGHNEQLRRIAQEIIVEQQQEIVAMRLALGLSLPPSTAAPDQPGNLGASPQPRVDQSTTALAGKNPPQSAPSIPMATHSMHMQPN